MSDRRRGRRHACRTRAAIHARRCTTWLVLIVVVTVGCDAEPDRASGRADILAPAPEVVAGPDLAAVLDDASRDLLPWIDPAESIEATIDAVDPDGVARAARERGLTAQVISRESTVVDGQLDAVLTLARAVHPLRVGIGEDPRALRWIPDALPRVAVPEPGLPYLDRPFEADSSGLDMIDQRRVPMLQSLAPVLATIDGRPYRQLRLSGSCDPEAEGVVCNLWAVGSATASGERQDARILRGTERTGWRGAVVRDTVTLQSVPRPLVRSAEWMARHDSGALSAINTFSTCCGAAWDPEHPGWIELQYSRPCEGSAIPGGGPIASTGDCFEALRIVVDIGAGLVLSVTPPA